jgi:hypothetical protein
LVVIQAIGEDVLVQLETQSERQSGVFHVAHRWPKLPDAVQLAAAGFNVPVTDELIEDVLAHLASGDVYTLSDGVADRAFAIFERYPVGDSLDVLYLAGIHVDPDFQGSHVCERLVASARGPKDRVLVLRTQSPIMWAAGRRICYGAWYLNPHVSGSGTLAYELARLLAPHIGAKAYPVAPGHYRENLYGELPQHRDAAIQAWWKLLCNAARGDAVICSGLMR